MRSPIQRHLDKTFHILSFDYLELGLLAGLLVLSVEVANGLGLSHFWPWSIVVGLALSVYWFRSLLGHGFGVRLWRFARLPTSISPRLNLEMEN